jgi:hypothetical protein
MLFKQESALNRLFPGAFPAGSAQPRVEEWLTAQTRAKENSATLVVQKKTAQRW